MVEERARVKEVKGRTMTIEKVVGERARVKEGKEVMRSKTEKTGGERVIQKEAKVNYNWGPRTKEKCCMLAT